MSGKKSRSNKTQIRILTDFMSTNNHLATGEFTGPLGSRRAEVQWSKLKDLLKNYGPDRTIEQWKQTWKDLKKNARHENALCALALNSTGNILTVPVVSDISKKILDTIGHQSSTGIGPAESAIGPISGDMEIVLTNDPIPVYFPSPTLPLPPPASPATPISQPFLYSLGHSLGNEENIAPQTHTAPNPPTTPAPTRPQPARPARATRPHDAFVQLQEDNNAILQNIASLLAERNILLLQQNALMKEANDIAKKNSSSRRFST